MRISPKILMTAGLTVMLLIGLYVWFGRPSSDTSVQPQATISAPDEPAPGPPRHSLFAPTRVRAKTPTPPEPTVAVESPATDTNVIADWEEKVDQLLTSPGESNAKAKELMCIFPRLPEAGQIDSVQHLVNLTSDENYTPLGGYLAQGNSSAEVLGELMDDLLNRPNSIKLPVLLEIARNPQHPESTNAREVLTFYLDEDYGDNWTLWGQKLAAWMKDNPD
jgi:hypothetical protein